MSEKPLSGKVLCCTSVTQGERTVILQQAVEMGAICQADLTADVTHLIAAHCQTEKYKYAARHRTDLRLMRTDWIPCMHKFWIDGKDVDLEIFEGQYILPVFYQSRICVTGLSAEIRQEIEQLVVQHGGHYSGDLTKENTHLIAGAPNGKKWEAVKAWQANIAIVSIEWLYESIKRGASLEEKYFALELPQERRGENSWFEGSSITKDIFLKSRKRKRPGQASVHRRSLKRSSDSNAESFWAEILSNDIEAVDEPVAISKQTRLPDVSLDLPESRYADQTSLSHNVGDLLDPSPAFFQDKSFFIDGFSSRELSVLQRIVESCGGTICRNETDEAYFIMPQTGRPLQQKRKSIAVTEYWVERCLANQTIEAPSIHAVSTPFTAELPLAPFRQISICISGYTGVDLLHIEKMIRLSGAVFSETLNRNISILLAPTRECRKYKVAKEKGLRIVKADWLWACLRAGKMLSFSNFALDGLLGSACRIDGNVLKASRKAFALCGVTCYIAEQYYKDYDDLRSAILAMGASVTTNVDDPMITHLIGFTNDGLDLERRSRYIVSAEWITKTLSSGVRQPESSYPQETNLVASDCTAGDSASLHTSHRKLTRELEDIKQKLSTFPVQKTSRRLLGRALTLPVAVESVERNEGMDAIHLMNVPEPSSQHITYSDPDASEQRRKVLALLSDKENEQRDVKGIFTFENAQKRVMTRAVGLDEQRKLRH